MNQASQTLAQLKKASKLVRLAFHKNGPKSYKRGQGALLNALVDNDGTTQRELVKILGLNRSELKDIVKKAERNGYVTIEDAEGERTYAVKLTDEGREVAQKRVAANDKTADDIIGCLSEEEIAQLNRENFVEAGGGDFHYVPWGNDSEGAVASLEEQARIALAGWV